MATMTKKKKILILDQSESTRRNHGQRLAALLDEFEIVTMRSPLDVIELLRKQEEDVVALSTGFRFMECPDMNGENLIRHLACTGLGKNLKAVVLYSLIADLDPSCRVLESDLDCTAHFRFYAIQKSEDGGSDTVALYMANKLDREKKLLEKVRSRIEAPHSGSEKAL